MENKSTGRTTSSRVEVVLMEKELKPRQFGLIIEENELRCEKERAACHQGGSV